MDMIEERHVLSIERIREIAVETVVPMPFLDFFRKNAAFLLTLHELYGLTVSGQYRNLSQTQLKQWNERLFGEIKPENYQESYANPAYAVRKLGKDYGQLLSYLHTKKRSLIRNVVKKETEQIVLQQELFIEIYNYFENIDETEKKDIFHTLYSYEKDNTEIFAAEQIAWMVDPTRDYYTKIVMDSNLDDLRYLYYYGAYIGENERRMASFLNGLPQEKIDKIARTYAQGFQTGFIKAGKPLEKKKTVQIRYNIGFERIVKSAVLYFETMGLQPVISPSCVKTTEPNPQYSYDHREDMGLYFDKAYVKRSMEARRQAFEENKKDAALLAGPAVIETFGETPFEPESKPEAVSLSREQQKLKVQYQSEQLQLTQEYIREEERSFTIIAFPVPEIGENFPELFEETIKINTLDAAVYEKIQQTLIDTLDRASYVRVTGRGSNKTDMRVQLHELKNPSKETNFENCVADVNIPLGEVFTSPQLAKTSCQSGISERIKIP